MIVLSLYDLTGIMVQPWAAAGYECVIVDMQHPKEPVTEEYGKGSITKLNLDLSHNSPNWKILEEEFAGQVAMLFGFPECTDMALSGSQWWAAKYDANPNFQEEAVTCAVNVEKLGKALDVNYMIENPGGILARNWRQPNYKFHPYEYGGYLPTDDVHPQYPDVIPPRDAYDKTTCLWTGPKFIMPPKRPVQPISNYYRKGNGELLKVSPIVAKTGGKSTKTKNIRSATPRGFAIATYYSNGVV